MAAPSRHSAPVVAGVIVVAAVVVVGVYLLTRGDPPVAPSDLGRGHDLNVEFLGAGNRPMQASLLVPPGPRVVPAVLIVPDSGAVAGAVDRNGPTPIGGVADRLYSDLATALAARGIASLRYDPRGSPTGTGQSSLAPGTSLRFEDVVADARAGLEFLGGRAEVNHRAMAVLGDGWGGLVALAAGSASSSSASSSSSAPSSAPSSASASASAAAPAAAPAPAAVVLVSTPGRPVVASLSDLLVAQAADPSDGQRAVDRLKLAAADLATGSAVPDPAQLPSALKLILAPEQLPYLTSVFSLDPPALAQHWHTPALIVSGGDDPAVGAADDQALAAAFGGPTDVVVAPGASNTLTIVDQSAAVAGGSPTTSSLMADMQNLMAGVGVPTTRDGATVARMVDWIASKLAMAAGTAGSP